MALTPNEIAKRLRALADEITMGTVEMPGGQHETPKCHTSGDLPSGWNRALCTFWAVEEKENDRGTYTQARIGLRWKDANGDAQSCFLSTFDKQLIMRIDPVMKGATVEYTTTRDKSGREKLADLRVTSR
jgi:hypothetical protein